MLVRFMESLLLVAVCIAASSTATAARCNIKLKIGTIVPVSCLPTKGKETKYVATHPSQLRPSIVRTIGGVEYTIAFDEETHRIKYIHTSDRAFRTTNGLRVGSEIKVMLNQITGGEGGWYMFGGRTPDGWDIVIAEERLTDWKKNETRAVFVSGFKKGGN